MQKTPEQIPEMSCKERLQLTKDSNEGPDEIASLLSVLSGIRREMMDLGSTEVDHNSARYAPEQPAPS
ncbi:MAG: hypothetical protein O3B01_15605 [Planctomycetota bacterium]|nr:hypothetical protein [Planctomycetota bacterium]MDA1140001.1 hypothetical protein [Planctomycetota bacterium]